ncbi:MAG: hypothetical protein MUC56_00660 [Thermoanaerobaculales bacterium]|jgi:hypothetical protein|nr:hypothetical protein [Thermoanaerobaculales bacterium]
MSKPEPSPRTLARRSILSLCIALCGLGSLSEAADKPGIRIFGEVNLNFRSSDFVELRVPVDFPPEFWEPGDDGVYLRTVDPGDHYELSDVELGIEAVFAEKLAGQVLVHVEDLYNRNPTSLDDRVFVRELWLRYGTVDGRNRRLDPWAWYLSLGKSARFARQEVRHLESYGLWGTAVNRFEIAQLQLGVNLGGNLYLRAQAGIAGPLFMRDVNALAGDNGTPERVPGNNNPKYNSGFPILYDARPENFELDGETEIGGGIGWRSARDDGSAAIDLLAWYFGRTLAEAPEIEGTFYQGDLELLRGAGMPLPFEGDEKWEAGLNVEWKLNRWVGFVQLVRQDIASLERQGLEVEMAYHIPFPPAFAAWDEPVFNWIRPAVRYSEIDNDFRVTGPFITPSMFWDWAKLDVGVRIGIVRSSDLTVEYSFNEATLLNGKTLEPNEWLVSWRIFW